MRLKRTVFCWKTAESGFVYHEATEAGISARELCSSEPVIIIGAGVAGLAAARWLIDAGRQVVVVEARRRVGGRIFTDRSFRLPVDCGASWIHGSLGNPLINLARNDDIATKPMGHAAVALLPEGGSVSRRLMPVADYYDYFDDILSLAEKIAWESEADIPLAAACTEALQRRKLAAPHANLLIDALLSRQSLIAAADLDDLSARFWDEERKFDGEDRWIPHGYDALLASLARDLPVLFGEPAVSVSLIPKGVAVKTTRAKITGCAAIITAPLGVLQEDAIAFDPPLPAAKQRAIERLSMGALEKSILCFPHPVWPEGLDHCLIPSKARDGGPASFTFFDSGDSGAYCVGWNAADEAAQAISEKDDVRIERALAALKEIFGATIPQPKYWTLTRWRDDPYARGAYSYVPVGGSSEDYDAIAEPLYERVFFAGEASCRECPGTVHGAYCSGIREAKRIV